MTVSLSQVFLTETEELKSRGILKNVCLEHFDVMFPVYPPQITCRLTCSDQWKVAYRLLFSPLNCIWVEDKPLGGVCKATMLVDLAVGNCAD